MRIVIGKKDEASLLLEGRRENAQAIIAKKIKSPELIEYIQGEIIDFITKADPTENKKYIEWAARRLSPIIRREVEEPIFFGDNLSDLYARFLENRKGFESKGVPYTDEMLARVKGMMRSDRFSAGHKTNEEKYDDAISDIKLNVWNRANVIARSLPSYHELAQRNLIDKNIDKFKEIYEWEHSVFKAQRDLREREEMKRREAGAKESTDYVFDDDDIMMVRPNSEDASCYYGRGTKWCISATESRNWYDEYSGKGTAFYFALFKHLPQNDPFKKLALVYTLEDAEEGMPSAVFDVADDELDEDAIREAARLNVLAKGTKKAIGSQLKKMKGESRGQFFKEEFSDIVHQFEQALQGEYDSPNDLDPETETIPSSFPRQIKAAMNALGMDLTEDLWAVAVGDDLQEFVTDAAEEQYTEIISYSADHLRENPGGPSDADFDSLIEQHNFDYVHVDYDYMDETRRYWTGYASIDITDIDEDLEDADIDEAADIVRQLMDDNSVYMDEIDGYGNDLSLRFDPDYDENEGLNGFESFLNRMDDVDKAIRTILDTEKETTLDAFKQAGMITGVAVKTLLQYFEDLELTNFESEIEEREVSVFKRMNITVPMPPQLYLGLTADEPAWGQQNRAKIEKSPALQAYDKMLKDNQTEHSDELIQQIRDVFDRLFEMLQKNLASELPGLESGKSLDIEHTGLLVPDYNVSIYRSAFKTEIGPSGLLISYFFDVRIEADEEETSTPENLKLIELFLRRIDSPEMLEKIRDRIETIVSNDAVRNIIPQFKEDGDEPEVDPVSGKILSKGERDAHWELQQTLDSVMQENKRSISLKIKKRLLKENLPFGGYSPGPAGSVGINRGTTVVPYNGDNPQDLGDDTSQSAKAVMYRNGKVLLIKNDKGWDLPGGHIQQAETIVSALMREIFEETGLSVNEKDITNMNMRDRHKTFFCVMLPSDDITLSDEHFEYGFFTLEEAMQLDNLSKSYRKAVYSCLSEDEDIKHKNIKIKIGGHGAGGMVPAGPK
jgi:8-oxo-dGTP pyrophosphatase MutT (NUDIX family)